MIFKISKNVLNSVINSVIRAINSNSPVKSLTGILIDVNNDSVSFLASDSDLTIFEKLLVSDENNKLEIQEEGSIVLDARYLSEIIRKIEGSIVNIEMIDGTLVKIYDDLTDFNLNGMLKKNYPDIEIKNLENNFNISKQLLKKMIQKTIFATSLKETRPVLTGINFNYTNSNKTLTLIATDSYRLSLIHEKISFENDFNINVPRKVLVELIKSLEDDNNISVSYNNQMIQFNDNHSIIQSTLLDGIFPETKRLIPNEFSCEYTFNKKQLENALDRSSFLKTDNNLAYVKFSAKNDLVTITNISQEVGSFKETIKCLKNVGDDIVVSFSVKFMLDALKSLDNNEVIVKFSGDMRPFVIVDPNNDKHLNLVVPVRSYN